MGKKVRKMNAARVLFGISRIGYTPASAICDIIDNAVSASATNIHVLIKHKFANINRKNNVSEYLIIDDGKGMSSEKLDNALDLGSSSADYSEDTLSKFGLGLKSASFAQGNRLEVITGDGKELTKQYVDLDEITDEYFSVEEELSEEDKKLVSEYFSEGKKGTIIRISKIHENNHPSIKSTMDELKTKIGVIYYYFLERKLHIFIESEEIKSFDPLFVNEAEDKHLDENVWEGKSVEWLLKPQDFMIDSDMRVSCKIEITMLPHPRVFKDEGITDAEIRNKYHISAQNYGFYVYRNGRLINWANRLDIIPQDQDFYSFRGRIIIDDTADGAFNIDVSKSHINLSEEARASLDDFVAEYKRKCKIAWNNAYSKFEAKLSSSSNEASNSVANEVGDYLESSDFDDEGPDYEKEYDKREKDIVDEFEKKGIEDTISRLKDEENVEKTSDELTKDEIEKTIKGNVSVSALNKIFKVSSITDNALWEPYVDAEKNECVRISTTHRYSKVMYENNSANKDMQVLFELLLYIQSKAEVEIRKTYHNVEAEKVRDILNEYRLAVSEKLAKLCRKEEERLPPNKVD